MSEPTSSRPADAAAGHDAARIDLAGYVLGGLTVDEQVAVEAHLASCDDCRAELAELEPIPVLLDLMAAAGPMTDAAVGGAVGVPAPGEPVVAPAVRSRRVIAGVAGVAAAVAVAAALLVGVSIGRGSEPSFSPSVALHAVDAPQGDTSASSAAGTAALRATEAGTIVRLSVSGLASDAGTYFECVWVSGQGAQSAGTFRVAPDGSAEVDLLTAARLYAGWSLEIVEHRAGDADGRPVLQAQA